MADLQIVPPHHRRSPVNTMEQERQEVLQSVLSAFSSPIADLDEMAACRRLLRHLRDTPKARVA